MDYLEQSFEVHFDYKVYFTSGIFDKQNKDFDFFLRERNSEDTLQKILFIIDDGVLKTHLQLKDQIRSYFTNSYVSLVNEILVIPGGEEAKNNLKYFDAIVDAIDVHKIDRHSYVTAIGGGSVLDVAGFAS